MSKEEERKTKKKESNKRYQEKLKAVLRKNNTNLRYLRPEIRQDKTDLRPEIRQDKTDLRPKIRQDRTDLRPEIRANMSLTWAQIESVFLSPEASILAILITVFSSYLIYQGTIFFQNMELNLLESVLSSFFGEILCVTTAGLFVVSSTRFSKFLSGFILLFSVVFLALFLHRGVENQLQKSTPEYQRLEQSFSGLKQEIKELREEKKQFPANFISKKEQKQTQINSKLKEKNQLSIELSYLEKESSIGVSGYYNAWLRIALMLINVLLVHRFFVYFKPRCS